MDAGQIIVSCGTEFHGSSAPILFCTYQADHASSSSINASQDSSLLVRSVIQFSIRMRRRQCRVHSDPCQCAARYCMDIEYRYVHSKLSLSLGLFQTPRDSAHSLTSNAFIFYYDASLSWLGSIFKVSGLVVFLDHIPSSLPCQYIDDVLFCFSYMFSLMESLSISWLGTFHHASLPLLPGLILNPKPTWSISARLCIRSIKAILSWE